MISSQYVSRVTLQRDKVGSFDRYPFFLPAVRSFDQIDLHSKVTYFVGENGSGKSTLLEAIAVSLGFNAEGGSKNFRFGTRRSHSELHEYLRVGARVFSRSCWNSSLSLAPSKAECASLFRLTKSSPIYDGQFSSVS
jgi:predicted ATPase